MQDNKHGSCQIRSAVESDFVAISALVRENAQYVKVKDTTLQSADELVEDGLKSSPPKFYCLVCVVDDEVVGYCTYNSAYSTWVGRMINILDFYVRECNRKQVQDDFVKFLVKKANDIGCKRIAWLARKDAVEYNDFWTRHGSIDITLKEEWIQYRLESDKFQSLIDRCS